MFKFFRKRRNRSLRADYVKLARFLSKNQLLDHYESAAFFEQMFDAFLRKVGEEERADYRQFRSELCEASEQQRQALQTLLSSGVSAEGQASFLSVYNNSLNASFVFESGPILFISYWDKLMKKLAQEISSTSQLAGKAAFELFAEKFDTLTKEEFEARTRPVS